VALVVWEVSLARLGLYTTVSRQFPRAALASSTVMRRLVVMTGGARQVAEGLQGLGGV
jgi:hypothetical protein